MLHCSSPEGPRAPPARDEAPCPAAGPGPVSIPDRQGSPRRVTEMLVVVVEWSIRKGREPEFLRYWSERETIADRAGLMGEFLNRVRPPEEMPFATWRRQDACSTFLNVGLWRDCRSFVREIGPKLTRDGRTMPFEYEARRRIFLGPERWRLGGSRLPTEGHAAVL